MRTFTAALQMRCPEGLPPIGSEAEREPLLMKCNVAKAGQPWEPGLTPNAIWKHLTELGEQRIQGQVPKESSLERVAQLEALARQLAAVSPHQLRHGLAYRLWKQATPAHVQRI